MSCLRPIEVNVRKSGNGRGTMLVPCGKCDECLQRRKMSFVFRCEQERISKGFKYCHYVTLTYSDEFLPYQSFSVKCKGSPVDVVETGESLLCPYDLSQFFKRYRLFTGDSIKYFACGEYGSEKNTHRPHFHIILFCNQNWKECVHFSNLAWSYLVAETLEQRKFRYKLQRKLGRPVKRDLRNMANRVLIGRVNVLSVTYRRTCYVAKYCNKVLYSNEVVPPFVRLSNGLGKSFLQSDTCECCKRYNRHFTFFQNGCQVAIPRYYSHLMFTKEQMEAFELQVIKESSPPEDFVFSVFKPAYDEDGDGFFLECEDYDRSKVKEWMRSSECRKQQQVKASRLRRYGFYL